MSNVIDLLLACDSKVPEAGIYVVADNLNVNVLVSRLLCFANIATCKGNGSLHVVSKLCKQGSVATVGAVTSWIVS